jgi:hypothetical protein
MIDKAEVRETLIRIALRHSRPGAGSPKAFLLQRTYDMDVPDLRPVLDPIPWAVVGAVAARHYMPERMTRDLDIAVWHEDTQAAHDRLAAAGFSYTGQLTIGGSSWQPPEGLPLDVVELRAPWARQALQEAHTNRDPHGLPILPLPYLVLMKFESGRLVDMADLSRMLGQASDDQLAQVRQLFAKLRPGDLEDLESLIYLGRLELQDRETDP